MALRYMPIVNERFSYVVLRKATLHQQADHPPHQRAWKGVLPADVGVTMSPDEARTDTTGMSLASEEAWLVPPPTAGATRDKDGNVVAPDPMNPLGSVASDSEAEARARLHQWRADPDSDGTGEPVWESDQGHSTDQDQNTAGFGGEVVADEAGTGDSDGIASSDGEAAVVDVQSSLADAAWDAVAEGAPGAGQLARIVRCDQRVLCPPTVFRQPS